MVNIINMPQSRGDCLLCHRAVNDPVGHDIYDRIHHVFCRTCIADWFARTEQRICPICFHDVQNADDYAPQQAADAQMRADAGLSVVQFLRHNGEISQENRGSAVYYAALRNRLDIVQAFLADGEISENDRGLAVMRAAENGRLDIVQALLAHGEISPLCRALAINYAIGKGYMDIIQRLMA